MRTVFNEPSYARETGLPSTKRLCSRCVAILSTTLLASAALTASFTAAHGENRLTPSPPDGCKFKLENARTVKAVTDSENLLLDDRRELNLGILTASLDDADAKRSLEDLVTGRAVFLSPQLQADAENSDRYGRLHANAAVRVGGNSVWLQGSLVAQGLARVQIDKAMTCGRSELLALENEARRLRLGHWATGVFAVLDANDSQQVSAFKGRFAIIEGRPRRRSKTRKGIYYNYGRNWHDDVTVLVPSRLANPPQQRQTSEGRLRIVTGQARTAGASAHSFDLNRRPSRNVRLRARGWIVERGGPLIEIRNLDQLEWIDESAPLENKTPEALAPGAH